MTKFASPRTGPERWVGLLLVILFHGTVLYGLWSYRLVPTPDEAVTLFVNFVNPPLPQKKEPPPPPPPRKQVKLEKPHPVTAPPQPVLAANAPVVSPADVVAPPPPPEPAPAPVQAAPAPPGPPSTPVVEAPPAPVMLGSDLAVSCPQRSPPEYPAMSRRLREQGRVVLRVELDETGQISAVHVAQSSGAKRLDEAGLTAVKSWRCNPATRDGKVVRAVALQPFDFILEGRR